MKKIIRIAIQTLVAFAALGCVKENAFETIPGDSIIREFTASFDGASTKTALGSGNAVLWEAGDRIDYMYSTSNGVQSMTVAEKSEAVKIWVEMEESDTWFTAVYGASTVAKGPVEGVFTVSGVVPSVQDGLFPSAHVSVAHLSGKELDSKELKFRNLTSLIKFSLTREDVAAVVFTANEGESISFGASGLAAISFDGSGNPKASSIGETSSEITIDINGAGTYYISILPQTLEAGFALKCYDGAGGDLGEVRYDNPLEIRRSSIATLGDISSWISQDGPEYEPSEKDFVERVNGIDLEMVYVEGGTFAMGATSEQGSDYYSEDLPVHNVTLSSYYIGRFEVTQAQWKAVMGTNQSWFSGDDLPVESVSWDDAQAFVQKLSALTGRTYCLPTEAQWEYAARGGNKSKGYKYSGSNDINEVAWYYYNSGSMTHPVGTKMPNELGLYDMSGNVWEWCSDWYGSYSSGDANNPAGPSAGWGRVLRGGGWGDDAQGCRVSFRSGETPGNRHFIYGFRVVVLP